MVSTSSISLRMQTAVILILYSYLRYLQAFRRISGCSRHWGSYLPSIEAKQLYLDYKRTDALSGSLIKYR